MLSLGFLLSPAEALCTPAVRQRYANGAPARYASGTPAVHLDWMDLDSMDLDSMDLDPMDLDSMGLEGYRHE